MTSSTADRARLGRLSDLMGTIEARITGADTSVKALDDRIPSGDSYLLVLFDGLGTHQLEHPAAASLRRHLGGSVAAPFPTTTTVSLSTVATGHQPSRHGVLGHLLWIPELGKVVNTLKWVDASGRHIQHDTSRMLPADNLWERVDRAGWEPVTVQPADYQRSPLSRMLYRGCRFEGVHSIEEWVTATVELARPSRRLVFAYLPQVDVAAHLHGQSSPEYRDALRLADTVWSTLNARLPQTAVAVGTADHGHLDYRTDDKYLIRGAEYDHLRMYGDSRSLFVSGPEELIERLVIETGADRRTPAELRPLWGDDGPDHPDLTRRLPDAVLLAPPGRLLLPRGFDKRLIGYHGGITDEERLVPLLVASG